MGKIGVFILLLFPIIVNAQPQAGVYGLGAFPTGEFSSNYRNGIGFGFEFLSNNIFKYSAVKQANKVKLRAGAGFNFTSYGREKFELELAAPQQGKADVKIYNSAFTFSPMLRLSFGSGKIQPYTEAFCGWNFFSASQSISPKKQDRNSEFENKTESELLSSNAFFYGISAGNMFKLSDEIYANVGVSYAMGEPTKLLPLSSIKVDGNELKYKFENSRTDMLLFKFGLTFYIHPQEHVITSSPSVSPSPQQNKKPNILRKNDPVRY